MTLRHANRVWVGTFALVAMAAVWPARADSFDQRVNPAGSEVRRSAPPAAADVALTGNPVLAIPLSELAGTRDRPIFSPSRRPPPVAVAAPIYVPPPAPRAVKAEPERPPLTLVGTIAGENDAIAVFVVQGTGATVRLHPNDNHEGWTLRSVQGREAVLQKGGESAVLALAPPGGSPEPVTAQASAETPPARKPRR